MSNDDRRIRNKPGVTPAGGVVDGTDDFAYLEIDPSGNLKTTASISGDVDVDTSSYSTVVSNLVTTQDIGSVDDTWVDQGAEIDMVGYNCLGAYVRFTVNDSTGNQLQVLSKHTSSGAIEYPLEVSSEYQKTIGDADRAVVYKFSTDGVVPYLQIQTKATDVIAGGGTDEGVITIDIIKSWS